MRHLQAQSTSTYSAVQSEVYWGIRKHCQCTYSYFQYIRLNNGYFTCAAGGYITFRANLHSTSITVDPTDLKSALTTWLHGQDTDKTITIYGMQYSVGPGPCGVTVPHLYAPKCSTPKTTATPTEGCNRSHGNCPCDHCCGCNGHRTHTSSCQQVRKLSHYISQICMETSEIVYYEMVYNIILMYIVPFTHMYRRKLLLLLLKELRGSNPNACYTRV